MNTLSATLADFRLLIAYVLSFTTSDLTTSRPPSVQSNKTVIGNSHTKGKSSTPSAGQ